MPPRKAGGSSTTTCFCPTVISGGSSGKRSTLSFPARREVTNARVIVARATGDSRAELCPGPDRPRLLGAHFCGHDGREHSAHRCDYFFPPSLTAGLTVCQGSYLVGGAFLPFTTCSYAFSISASSFFCASL